MYTKCFCICGVSGVIADNAGKDGSYVSLFSIKSPALGLVRTLVSVCTPESLSFLSCGGEKGQNSAGQPLIWPLKGKCVSMSGH